MKASTTINPSPSADPLISLRQQVSDKLDQVDSLIYELIKNKISLIPQISEHTISSGGKRLRPVLTLACANMCNYKGNADVDLAACVEFIHTATLLHDDVVDTSNLRRGSSTANSLWGNKESILVGDYLLGKSFHLMGAAKSLEIYQILSNAAVIISEGEVIQLAITGDIEQSTNQYIDVISSKTAELFAAACQVGGVLAQVSNDEVQALRTFGLNLGRAFQIIDDMLDYYSCEGKTGKNIGDDFKERKVTLPVILAYQNATPNQKDFWNTTINQGQQKEGDVETAIKFMSQHDVFNQVIHTAKKYTNISREALCTFPESTMRSSLLDVLDFVVHRDF